MVKYQLATNAKRFYRNALISQEWREVRQKKLSLNPLCEVCQAKGIETPATDVHHIRPVESVANPGTQRILMFDLLNLQSLCHPCHNAKHVELKSHTKEERQRRTTDEARDAIARFFGSDPTT